jgi:hypothetical protein
LHGMLLPCASLASDTTHACRDPSKNMVTSAFSSGGGNAALDAGPADRDPHAASRSKAAPKTKAVRTLMSTPNFPKYPGILKPGNCQQMAISSG